MLQLPVNAHHIHHRKGTRSCPQRSVPLLCADFSSCQHGPTVQQEALSARGCPTVTVEGACVVHVDLAE